jgi:hypothetical protein
MRGGGSDRERGERKGNVLLLHLLAPVDNFIILLYLVLLEDLVLY